MRLAFPVAVILSMAGPASSAGAAELVRHSFSGGFMHAGDSTHVVRATLGAAVDGAMAGSGYQVRPGFWAPFWFQTATDAPGDVAGSVLRYANHLGQSFPNPFRGSTRISFTVAEATPVRLVVFDVTGRRVATVVDEVKLAGRHEASWSGRDDSGRTVASGVYFYRLDLGSWSKTKRMLRLR